MRRNMEGWWEVEKDEGYHLGKDVEEHYRGWLERQSARRRATQSHQITLQVEEDGSDDLLVERAIQKHQLLTYGYVTQDQCPGLGDDVPHQPLPAFDQPDYIGTVLPPAADKVDVVFFSFITKFSLAALNSLAARSDSSRRYTIKDVRKYTEIESNQVLGLYALDKWHAS